MLGPSHEDVLSICDYKYSLKTVLMRTDQMLYRIGYLHAKNFIHLFVLRVRRRQRAEETVKH